MLWTGKLTALSSSSHSKILQFVLILLILPVTWSGSITVVLKFSSLATSCSRAQELWEDSWLSSYESASYVKGNTNSSWLNEFVSRWIERKYMRYKRVNFLGNGKVTVKSLDVLLDREATRL